MSKIEWLLCPVCKGKTRIKLLPDTVLEDGDDAFLDFRGKDVKPARSVLYPRNGNDGGIQRGQRPFLAHGLCLQSLVCYTLYLRVCEKSGTGILVAGFEADKKSFVSVPVSVTEVKLFD